jgi:hypothetical protein
MSTLILPAFDLLVPQTLQEAVGFLAQLGKDVAVLAGSCDGVTCLYFLTDGALLLTNANET